MFIKMRGNQLEKVTLREVRVRDTHLEVNSIYVICEAMR